MEIKIILELLAIILLIFGYMHEDDVIKFEKRLYKKIRSKTKMVIEYVTEKKPNRKKEYFNITAVSKQEFNIILKALEETKTPGSLPIIAQMRALSPARSITVAEPLEVTNIERFEKR